MALGECTLCIGRFQKLGNKKFCSDKCKNAFGKIAKRTDFITHDKLASSFKLFRIGTAESIELFLSNIELNPKNVDSSKVSKLTDYIANILINSLLEDSDMNDHILSNDGITINEDQTETTISEQVIEYSSAQISETSSCETSPKITGTDAKANTISKTICKFYKQNKCQYGQLECKFDHPKKCRKILEKGTCNQPKCILFHPKMCFKSISDRKCYSDKCKYSHVKGTARKIIQSERDDYFINQQSVQGGPINYYPYSNHPDHESRYTNQDYGCNKFLRNDFRCINRRDFRVPGQLHQLHYNYPRRGDHLDFDSEPYFSNRDIVYPKSHDHDFRYANRYDYRELRDHDPINSHDDHNYPYNSHHLDCYDKLEHKYNETRFLDDQRLLRNQHY